MSPDRKTVKTYRQALTVGELVDVFLRGDFIEKLTNPMLDLVLNSANDLFSQISIQEVGQIQKSKSSVLLFNQWFDKESFGDPPTFSNNLLCLMHNQSCTRSTILAPLI